MARCLLSLFMLGLVGCGIRPYGVYSHRVQEPEKNDPKKLFEWAISKEREGDDKNKPTAKELDEIGPRESNNGKKKEPGESREDEDSDDEIQTDRPDFTESSTTVGKGRIQLETGYTFTRDRANGMRLSANSFPEALLRIGLLAEWFELRIGQNFDFESTRMPDGSVETARGAEDLYLGVKLALTEQKKYFPEMALVFQMTVPSGSKDLTAQEVLPGINWLYGWDVVKDRLSIGGSTQGNRMFGTVLLPAFTGTGELQEPVEGKHSFLEIAQSLTVNYSLTRKLRSYTEWFAFFPHSSLDPEVGPEYYLDGGFTYKFTPNTQFDIRAGFGLNRHADDFFAGSGISFRY